MVENSAQACTLREAEYEDCEAATELLRGLGLILPDSREEIHHHWRRFWIDNPALDIEEPNLTKGWLLENNGRMVGFFGNIPLLYDFGGQPIIIADASQWGVEKEFRSETSRLADAYFNQKNADLLFVTTGIKPTGRLFDSYGGLPVPQTGYDQVLYWVLNVRGFLKAGLVKKGLRPGFASLVASTAGLIAGMDMTLSSQRLRGRLENIDIINIADIGDEFDDLWRRKRGEAERLLACRTAECLRWHFGTDSMMKRTRLLVSRKAGRLEGYVTVMREDSPGIDLKRLKVIDLFVANDDEGVINNLLAAAYETGSAEGCHVLELVGLPANLRGYIISQSRPRSRPMPTWPLYYKNLRSDFEKPLRDENTWYVTAYDGDTAIF